MTKQDEPMQQPIEPAGDPWGDLSRALSFIVIGFGIGWLMGLSASPIIATVMSALVGIITALTAVIGGAAAQGRGLRLLAPGALALLIFGLVIGSMVGLNARTHDWFGLQLRDEVATWTELGLNKAEVAQALFDRRYGQAGGASGTTERTTLGVLFDVPSNICDTLLGARTGELKVRLGNSSDPALKLLAESTDEPERLREGLLELC